jgi:hypothetical protein
MALVINILGRDAMLDGLLGKRCKFLLSHGSGRFDETGIVKKIGEGFIIITPGDRSEKEKWLSLRWIVLIEPK